MRICRVNDIRHLHETERLSIDYRFSTISEALPVQKNAMCSPGCALSMVFDGDIWIVFWKEKDEQPWAMSQKQQPSSFSFFGSIHELWLVGCPKKSKKSKKLCSSEDTANCLTIKKNKKIKKKTKKIHPVEVGKSQTRVSWSGSTSHVPSSPKPKASSP